MTVDTTEMTTNVHEPFDQYRPREGLFALCRFSDQARLCLRRPSEAVKPGLIAAQWRMSSTRADRVRHPEVWPGCVYAWLCTSATVEGRACGRPAGSPARLGNRPTPVNGCPQRIRNRALSP